MNEKATSWEDFLVSADQLKVYPEEEYPAFHGIIPVELESQ